MYKYRIILDVKTKEKSVFLDIFMNYKRRNEHLAITGLEIIDNVTHNSEGIEIIDVTKREA